MLTSHEYLETQTKYGLLGHSILKNKNKNNQSKSLGRHFRIELKRVDTILDLNHEDKKSVRKDRDRGEGFIV